MLTSPFRYSQRLGLAGVLRPNPTRIRFGQEGEIATQGSTALFALCDLEMFVSVFCIGYGGDDDGVGTAVVRTGVCVVLDGVSYLSPTLTHSKPTTRYSIPPRLLPNDVTGVKWLKTHTNVYICLRSLYPMNSVRPVFALIFRPRENQILLWSQTTVKELVGY